MGGSSLQPTFKDSISAPRWAKGGVVGEGFGSSLGPRARSLNERERREEAGKRDACENLLSGKRSHSSGR